MKLSVFGTGSVGALIASKLIECGYEVMMASRTANNEKAKSWAESTQGKGKIGTFADGANFADIIFNCTKGEHSIVALQLAKNDFANKIIIDLANPLDFSKGMPPSLIAGLCNTHSLGEEIQKQFPKARVVKTLNTMWGGLMVNPSLIGNGDHINYYCGNDESAKASVKTILLKFGWKENSLIDLGDLTGARATEGVLPIWLRVYGVTKTGAFNFTIVK